MSFALTSVGASRTDNRPSSLTSTCAPREKHHSEVKKLPDTSWNHRKTTRYLWLNVSDWCEYELWLRLDSLLHACLRTGTTVHWPTQKWSQGHLWPQLKKTPNILGFNSSANICENKTIVFHLHCFSVLFQPECQSCWEQQLPLTVSCANALVFPDSPGSSPHLILWMICWGFQARLQICSLNEYQYFGSYLLICALSFCYWDYAMVFPSC